MGKPHGIAGEVYVVPISDDPTRFEPGSTLVRSDGSRVTVAESRRHAARLLIRFEGVETRAAAEALRGPLYVAATELRELGDDEFWPHDLEGCEVIDDEGVIGWVTRVVTGASQDLLAINTPRGERLVPLVKEIVTSVDVAGRRITLDAPLGLLD